jgi:6-pyruvoyltetrahydropterin/6-carboxytetrahydropterin synthase
MEEAEMYRIGVSAHFSAAHFLDGYDGTCEGVHGHNYKVEALLEAKELNRIGLGMDFRQIKKALDEALQDLDHRLLNKAPIFEKINPTAENIARHIFGALEKDLSGGKAVLAEVKVWETSDTWASYAREDG